MKKASKIYVAGHRGLVGSALVRCLTAAGYENLLLRTSKELDLRNQSAVEAFFSNEKPDFVFLAAARVGGIMANKTYPADFIYDNLAIQNNVLHASYVHGVQQLLFLGSSCIYPKMAAQPLRESYLLSGPLEPSNEPYAVAKIAGVKLCEAYNKQYGTRFVAAMPTNLYGPNDNFDLQTSHVLPALIRKFHQAYKEGHDSVTLWGTGTPRREFLHCDDLADACLFLMRDFHGEHLINVGVGKDLEIRELAALVAGIVGFDGEIKWDTSKPDGTPRKIMDVSRLNELGWQAKIGLEDGIRSTVNWYREQIAG